MLNFVRNDSFRRLAIYLPFALLFGLIPYRFLGILHVDSTLRVSVGFFLFLLFLSAMTEFIIIVLNSNICFILF